MFAPWNQHQLLAGFQYLMSTTDGGEHWKKLSPDLGYPKGVTPPPDSLVGRGGRGGRGGGAAGGLIESFSPSTVAPGTIWVGTNNGLIKLTRDTGRTWADVSIPDLPDSNRSVISTIEASHHSAGTAYAAVDGHRVGDYAPHFYRTRDFGKTWTPIVNGFATGQPNGSFARVIRADTKKAGLLFAGTESSFYVSFDDGDTWQSLMLNLPTTSYRDMTLKDNDLVVGTYGRGIWILDDISPLRQITPAIAGEPAHLFKPGDAVRVRRNVNQDTPFPPEVPHALNPPDGAVIYYYLGAKPSGDVTLDVIDGSGKTVRHMSSAAVAPVEEAARPTEPNFWIAPPFRMPAEAGTNRINWDIRYDDPPAFSHSFEINANPGETPASPEGPLALPGTYTVKLTVDGKAYTQTVAIRNDPRSPATGADLRLQHALQMKIYNGIREAYDAHEQVEAMRGSVAALSGSNPPADVAATATALEEKLVAVGGEVGGRGRGGGGGGGGGFGGRGGGGAPPSFVAINGSLVRQLNALDTGDMAPTDAMNAAWLAGCRELRTAVTTWRDINAKDLPALNALIAKGGGKAIPAASPLPAVPSCAVAAPVGRGGTGGA